MSWVDGPSANWPDDKVWVSSFDECFCGYFDDLALDDGFEFLVREQLLSTAEVRLTASFHKIAADFDPIDPTAADELILVDDKWRHVTHEAARAWNALKAQFRDREDLE